MSVVGLYYVCIFFFKQKTAYDMRISDWSSDVCSSDLFGGGSERQSVFSGLLDGAYDLGMRMAQNGRTPGAHVVDIACVVRIPHIGTLGALDEARCAAHRSEGPDGRIDSAGYRLAGAVE